MVPRGLEPRTLRLLAVRSNQLSYETRCTVPLESSPTGKFLGWWAKPCIQIGSSLNYKGRCGVGVFYIDNRVAATTFTGEEFGHIRFLNSETQCIFAMASVAQLVEHALRKRTVVGSIPMQPMTTWQPV